MSTITVKAKNIVNIKKAISYKTFIKKLGVNAYNKEAKNKKINLNFITGVVNLIFDDPERESWQYLQWEIRGIKRKKITPNTKILLCLQEDWEAI